jgi:acyl dehydratase
MSRLADIAAGEELPERTFDICPADMHTISALMHDPNPIHFDREYVDTNGYDGLIHQGPANLAFLLQAVTEEIESPADIDRIESRFETLVYADDTVTATGKVVEKRDTIDGEVADLAIELKKADGTTAVSGTVTVRIK